MKNKTNAFSAEASFAAAAKATDFFTIQIISAGGRFIKQAKYIEQSSFTTTGWSHNHNKFAAFDGEREIFESERFSVAITVTATDVNQFNEFKI